jgi:hypothetical protein
MPLNVVCFRRGFEFVLPAEHAGLGSKVFGLVFVAALDPNAREAGVDVNVICVQCVGLFGCFKRVVVVTFRKVDFSEGMPDFEGLRVGLAQRCQLGTRGFVIAHGKVKGGIVDLVLKRSVVGHVFWVALRGRRFCVK